MKHFDKLFEKSEEPVKKDRGTDDKKFMALMSEYKQLRRGDDREKARKKLKQAQDLGRKGDVSAKAKTAAAYL